MRFNVLEFFIFLAHKYAFSFSPVDKKRYLAESMQKRRKHYRDLDDLDQIDSVYYELTHLKSSSSLFALIKRQHLCGNWFIVFLFAHLSGHIHLTLKTIVHALITGNSLEMVEYFNSKYYPHPLSGYSNYFLYNNQIVAMCSVALCLRLRAFYVLIRNSLINQHFYKVIQPGQINVVYYTTLNLEWHEWTSLVRGIMDYQRKSSNKWDQIEMLSRLNASHGLTMKNLAPDLDNLVLTNHIDFNDVYELLGINFGLQKEKYKHWQIPEPIHRINPTVLIITCFIALSTSVIIVEATVLGFIGFVYLEVSSRFPDSQPSFSQVTGLLIQPLHIIKQIEFTIFIVNLIPAYMDTFVFFVDITTLISRIMRLTAVFQLYSRLTSQMAAKRWFLQLAAGTGDAAGTLADAKHFQAPVMIVENLINGQDEHILIGEDGTKDSRNSGNDLDKKLEYLIRLVIMIHQELKLIKRDHAIFINIVMIGNSICIAYSLALYSATWDEPGVTPLVVLGVMSLIAPVIIVLVCCTFLELSCNRLYKVMVRTMASSFEVCEKRSIELLRITSKKFELRADRSMIVAGQYAISMDMIAPLIAFILTAIIFLSSAVVDVDYIRSKMHRGKPDSTTY